MFTILRTARSCPTIFARSRRSKSSTSELRISGSRSTSSETNGLTIALHLMPVFPRLARTASNSASNLNPASLLPIQNLLQFVGRHSLTFGGMTLLLEGRIGRTTDLGRNNWYLGGNGDSCRRGL